MKKFLAILFLSVFVMVAARSQPKVINYELLTKTITQYGKAEWNIALSAPYTNPFDQKDITVDMVMTSPSGLPVVLPCFYVSGDPQTSHWKARFAPQERGVYTYTFTINGKGGSARSKSGKFNAAAGKGPGFLHKNNYYTFKFDNGTLFRGIGENVGWEARSFENDKYTYDYLLPTLSKNGANFFRTWMCYWNLPLEWQKVRSTKRYQNTDEYFNPGAIKRMDELVNLTDSLGLYFMLTLDWHGHLMDNGGWKSSPYNQLNGGPAKTPTDFFALQSAREKYKNKLRYVIARWGYSTNIAAFEFFNEIDNAAFNGQDSILIPHYYITEWHAEMSRYLKDTDPYHHMVTTSVSHRDIIGMNSIPYIDFNQKHIYKHTEKIPGIYPDYIQTFGKPYVVGEFGFRWEDADPKYAVDADYDYKRGLWYGMFSPAPILPMTWWWEFFDDQKMTPYFRGVREISDQMLVAGQGNYEPFAVDAGLLQGFGIKCGDKYFIYLLNNSSGKVSTPVSFNITGNMAGVQSFVPESRQYGKADYTINKGKITLKAMAFGPRQELVLIGTTGSKR